MQNDPLVKFADAYEDYRKRQNKKRLLTVLGALGIGAAGLFGFGAFRNAQIQKAMQRVAQKRKAMLGIAGLAGLGVAAPYAYNSLQDNPMGDLSSLLQSLGSGVSETARSAVSGLSQLNPQRASELLGGHATDAARSIQGGIGSLLDSFQGREESLRDMFDNIF